jgi:hypothetical protein
MCPRDLERSLGTALGTFLHQVNQGGECALLLTREVVRVTARLSALLDVAQEAVQLAKNVHCNPFTGIGT